MPSVALLDEDDDFEVVEGTNGGIMKKILVEGKGGTSPTGGDKVQVHYTGTLTADGAKFESSRDRDSCFEFQLGVGEVITCFELGVSGMKRGEKCILRCTSDFAYGENGCPAATMPPKCPPPAILPKVGGDTAKEAPPRIPPNAGLDFEVELVGWTEGQKKSWQMSVPEKMQFAEEKRVEGNEMFKAGDYDGAVKAYKAGLSPLQDMYDEMGGAMIARGKELTVKLSLNLAQARLKGNGDLLQVCRDCEFVLSMSPHEPKAFFRRGQANMRRCEWAKAKEDFEKLLTLDKDNKEAKAELQKIEAAQAKAKNDEKALCSKMFG